MGVFDPRPSFRGVTGTERMATAMDMPFSFGQAFGENFSQGVVDSFGLGTAIRELSTPAGNLGERMDNRSGYKPMLDPFGIMESGSRSLTEDEYKSSPYFRETVPFQAGLTADRAASLASFADTRAVRQYFSQKQPIAAFLGQFGGQALDPINYVPVFGQGAQLAAVARFGSIGGRALMSASEAAINTAAFGILTAGVRAKLGDDVSFEMIGTEIAMSALIGGAFGGGIGMLVRGRDARERVALGQARNALSTAANRQKAAIALNEQIDALATTGNPAATPNGMASIETVHTEVQRRVTAARSLDEQTAGVTGTKAGEVVIAPSGRRVSVVPEVVELDSLIHAEGALQVRNRRTAASDAQIEEIGATLDPARMMPNIDGSQGAPLVGADHIIDSGNGRVAGVRRAYEAYPEKAEAYRAFLAEQGYNVEGMQRPVLINRRVTNLDETARAQFNAELNGRTTASLGAVEIAQMDRAAMTDNVLDAHAPAPVTAASNRAFVQRFMAQLPANDRQALLSADGKALSAEGVRRIENALFASAYGDIDPSAVRRFAEGVDDNTRSIVGAMSDMAGAWAKMRRDAKAGVIPQHLDQTQELTDALRLIGMWREQAAREGRPVSKVISEGMAQMDLLTGEIKPETQVFIRSFYTSDAFARAQGREALAGQFADLIESGYELGRPSLFGDAMPEVSALQVLENAVRRNAETDLRPTGDALSRAEENGSADIEPAPGADRGLDRQGDEAGAEALAEADIFSHGADLGERPMSSADIADTMRERFENAGRPADEAEAAAGMLSTFYSTMAARTGRSINDLLKIAPLPEVRRGGQPDMSAQALAQSQPGNPAFDRWFGDSKVVDAEGKPLVVYHGTDADIDAFDPAAINSSGRNVRLLGEGFYFTSDPAQAAKYGKNVIPVYLRMESPRQQGADGILAPKSAGQDGTIATGTPGTKDGERVFVVKDPTQIKSVNNRGTFDPNDPRILYQGARGSIEFGSDGRSVMSMFDAADASTALHESAHWFLQMFRSFADRADAPAEIRADWERVRAWWTENADAVAADSPTGATGDDVRRLMETGTSGNRLVDIGIEVGMQEQWARGFEAYLREGVAPNEGLRGIFDQFKRWLTSIYRQALDLNVNINDDIRGVFDRLLAQQQGDLVPNSTAPKPDPVPDGLDAAAAAVRTPADPLKLGAQYGLDDAGGFAEQADIDALKAQKLITPEDQAMLDEADQLVADAEAYGRTLETAAWCMR